MSVLAVVPGTSQLCTRGHEGQGMSTMSAQTVLHCWLQAPSKVCVLEARSRLLEIGHVHTHPGDTSNHHTATAAGRPPCMCCVCHKHSHLAGGCI
jgi:hypothetical protein